MHQAILNAADMALTLAFKTLGATSPNPPVGAAALDAQGALLGVTVHDGAGTEHAEAKLIGELRQSGELRRVHTLIVTLEPCNHTGRRPPCTEAILVAGIQNVVYLAKDPNPDVLGHGHERLEKSGVRVSLLTEPAEVVEKAQELIRGFRTRVTKRRPFIVVKQVLNSDGSMVPPIGKKTFSSPQSLVLAHRLRRESDAILTGVDTVLQDRPEFTVRQVEDHLKRPLGGRILVIADRNGRTPADYVRAAELRGFEVWIEKDWENSLIRLADRGVSQLLVEAGPRLTSSVLSRLWDEHVLIKVPIEGADTVHVHRNY